MKGLRGRRFLAHRGGASAVEFSLVVTPLLLIAFGSLEFGRLMWTRAALQEVAMATARCMGVKQPSCAPSGTYSSTSTKSFAQTTGAAWSVSIPVANITLDNAASCAGVSGFSQVSISLTFQSAVPVLISSLSNIAPLQATACFPNQT